MLGEQKKVLLLPLRFHKSETRMPTRTATRAGPRMFWPAAVLFLPRDLLSFVSSHLRCRRVRTPPPRRTLRRWQGEALWGWRVDSSQGLGVAAAPAPSPSLTLVFDETGRWGVHLSGRSSRLGDFEHFEKLRRRACRLKSFRLAHPLSHLAAPAHTLPRPRSSTWALAPTTGKAASWHLRLPHSREQIRGRDAQTTGALSLCLEKISVSPDARQLAKGCVDSGCARWTSWAPPATRTPCASVGCAWLPYSVGGLWSGLKRLLP